MHKHEHQAERKKNFFFYLKKKEKISTRYLGENSCKSLTGISTPTAPNRIVSSCDYFN
jgi:hypothetical protein